METLSFRKLLLVSCCAVALGGAVGMESEASRIGVLLGAGFSLLNFLSWELFYPLLHRDRGERATSCALVCCLKSSAVLILILSVVWGGGKFVVPFVCAFLACLLLSAFGMLFLRGGRKS